jgi:hypothetical protein
MFKIKVTWLPHPQVHRPWENKQMKGSIKNEDKLRLAVLNGYTMPSINATLRKVRVELASLRGKLL